MILFHGSNVEITIIDLSKSKKYKDFGQAFYLSAEKEQAQKMAEERWCSLVAKKPYQYLK